MDGLGAVFGIAYGLGAAIYAYRERLSFTVLGIPMIIGLASLLYKFQVFEVAMNVMLAYIVMWAAYVKAPILNFLQTGVSYSSSLCGCRIYLLRRSCSSACQ